VHEEYTSLVELSPEQAPLAQVWMIIELGGVTSAVGKDTFGKEDCCIWLQLYTADKPVSS